MSGTKEYKIVINGITESVNAVDSLLKKLETLEQRIDAISQKQATVSTASGGSGGGSSTRKSDLTEEQKIADQINRSYEKRIALQGELGKQLQEEKQAMKELTAEQKSLAAKDRLAAGGYDSNTMLGMKAELADIKAAMQTMDVESEEFLKATERANELTTTLKNLEYAYGTFSRNVGNYPTGILDEMGEIKVRFGDQTLLFNSTKEALRTLKEEMRKAAVEGGEDSERYKNLAKSLHEVSNAVDRANDEIKKMESSSPALHSMLETFQSFGAMGQITQGFSAFFGNIGFEQSIQKLMSLQSMINGLKTLSDQMNTSSGLGKYFSQGSKAIDTFVSKMTGATKTTEGWTAATKTATRAAQGLSFAMKAIGTAGLMVALDWFIDKLQGVADALGLVSHSSADAIKGEELFKNQLEKENKVLENNILLIKIKEAKGEISAEESRRQQIEATTEALKKQYEQMLLIANLRNDSDEVEAFAEGTGKSDAMVSTELENRLELWNKMFTAAKANRSVYRVMQEEADGALAKAGAWFSQFITDADDTKEAFAKATAEMAGQFSNVAMYVIENYDKMADGGKWAITQLINAMNDGGLLNNLLTALPAVLGDAGNDIMVVVNGIMGQVRRIGVNMGIPGAKSVDDQITENQKALDKLLNNRQKATKTAAKKELDIEKEKQQMMLNLMADGYQKELTKLKQDYKDKEKRFKGHNDLLLLAQQEYEKKSEELREKMMKQQQEAYREMYRNIYSFIKSVREDELDSLDDYMEQIRKKAELGRKPLLYDTFGFYEQLTSSLKQTTGKATDDVYEYVGNELSKVSDGMKEIISDINDYIDEIIRVARDEGEVVAKVGEIFKGENVIFINTLKELYGNDYEDKKWDEVKKLFGESQTRTFEDLVKTLTIFRLREQNALQTFVENEEDLKQYYGKLLKRLDEKDRTFDEPEMYKKYEEWAKKRKEIIDAEYKSEELELESHYQKLAEEQGKYYDGQIDYYKDDKYYKEFYEQQKQKRLTELSEEYGKKQREVENKHQRELAKVDEEVMKKREEDLKNYFNDMTQEFRDYYEVINSMTDNLPQKDAFGFIDVSATNSAYRDTLTNLEKLNDRIMNVIQNVGLLHAAGRISTEDFKNYTRELMRLLGDVRNKIKEVNEGLDWKGKLQDFFQNLQQYYSAVTDSFQNILGAFQETQDYIIEKQMDALDKENEALQKKLEENEKILERHKEAVDKIEGELSDARGDRKEKLIDALNAEILAQRRAQAEREKLEKEQEKLEKQQKALEEKQKRLEYERGLQQILFQTSQAIMSAAVNSWPIPAVPLMALAAATGATQYALARQRKPYAEGGIIDGLSHSNGGVPVGNTGIEVEGGEYVVNRQSTENNRELLNLINTTNRRLSTTDLINFATNMSVSPLEANSPENTSIETAFVAYANRPIWVSVQDINSTQESVRRVEVLSGKRG